MVAVYACCPGILFDHFHFQNGPILDYNYVITVVITNGQIKYLESAAKIKKAPDGGDWSTWDPAQLLTSIMIWVSCFTALCLSSLSFLKGIVTASEWSSKCSIHAWEGLVTMSAPYLHVLLLSCTWLFATLWTVCSPQGSSVRGISQASQLPFPTPGDIPDPAIKPTPPAMAGRFFYHWPPGKPHFICRVQ